MAEHLFITGTGTGVGKTVVSALLAQGLLATGRSVLYWKPVQTGIDAGDDDTAWVKAQVSGPLLAADAFFRGGPPVSPDQVRGGPELSVAKLQAAAAALPEADFQLAEGAGGLLVPLNDAGETWADLAAAARWKVLVVAAPGLGTLNHVSLTLQVLASRAIQVAGVVLSGPPHAANEASLRRLYPAVALHAVPPVVPGTAQWQAAAAALAEFTAEALTTGAREDAPESWLEAARRHVWYPYTQHRTAPEPLPLARAHGVWLETPAGERLLDGTSAWWVNTIGHGRPEIARAVARQQQTLDHVLFAGTVHAGAARVAARVTALAGSGLTRAFFSDNGSTAVEIALKMAYQAFVNRGDLGRNLFLSFRGSYHGDTFGAMSVAQSSGFHGVYGPLMFKTVAADPVTEQPSALCPRGAEALAERLAELEATLHAHQHQLAGVVLEPLVQGAGGMLMQPAAFVQGVARLCRRYGLPLILDEVFTGLGRAGATFAFQRAGVEPDIVACAKGLTGGNLPLALTLAREDFFTAFLAEDRGKALLHGHSFTGNPIACAAALAALDIFEHEKLSARALALEARFQRWVAEDGRELGVSAGRALGGILAFELPGSGQSDYFHPAALRLADVARRHGLFLRPLGNTIYFLPPLVIADNELETGLRALSRTVHELTHG